MGEAAINAVFNTDTPKPWPKFSCTGMVQLEMAEAVIMTLENGCTGSDEFDKMGLNVGNVSFGVNAPEFSTFTSTAYFTVFSPALLRCQLQLGDWVRFWNTAMYKGGSWNAESTIMVGLDSYYGFGREYPRSDIGWKQLLADKYHDISGLDISLTEIQGYDDAPMDFTAYAGFINAWALGQRIFVYRSTGT